MEFYCSPGKSIRLVIKCEPGFPLDESCIIKLNKREYVYSVAVYQKYLTRLG